MTARAARFRRVATGLAVVGTLSLVACTQDHETDLLQPTDRASAEQQPESYTLARGDFSIDYLLEGMTTESEGVALVSGRSYHLSTDTASGAEVEAGARLGVSRVLPEVLESLGSRAVTSRIDASERARLLDGEGTVTAPVSGTFRREGRRAWIESTGIDVVVELSPIQALRYESLALTGEAVVETVVGRRTVPCVALSASSGTTQDVDTGTGTASSQIACRLPLGIETTAGLRAQLALASPTLTDVVTVPNDFLHYDDASDGYVVWTQTDGAVVPVEVDLGPSDGVRRVVTTELPEGLVVVRRTASQP